MVEAGQGDQLPLFWTDLVTAHAARSPDAIAIRAGREELSYAALTASADRLAHRLVELGVRPERRVALLMNRSIELVVAMLAVHRAGGAYLPIDPGYPARRVDFMLRDAAVSVLITDLERTIAVPSGIEVVELPDRSTSTPAPVDPGGLRPGHAAYLIYTSGSTGLPKGVVVPHTGIVNLVTQQIERFAVTEDSRVLQWASTGFDAAFSEVAMALGSGACLVMAPPSALVPGPDLAATVAEHAITHLTITPTALAVMDPADLASVSTLIVAGEAFPARAVADWAKGRRLINAYGPTETTVCATSSAPLTGDVAPIGRALPGVSTQVLDERQNPVPDGSVGELCVGGLGVARGYLGRSGLTAERFIADPWGQPGSRMYRTGDLVRRDDHGELEFVGRTDDQVKIRGQRVDTGEVEAVLGEYPGLRDVRVLVERDPAGAHCLAAYLVPSPEQPADDVALVGAARSWARQRMPEFMVPSRIVVVDGLPVGDHGKLDTDALRARRVPRPTSGAPRGAVIPLLCDLFADVLALGGGHECGEDDDFFELGGHSLVGVVLLSRIRALFGVTLTLPDLAEAATPSALASLLTSTRRAGPRRHAPVLTLRPRGDGPALFCLPPATGLGLAYGRLLPVIGPDSPLHALQDPGLDATTTPIETMRGLIEHYVTTIRRIRPHGPYHLLGWSHGGVLAHAVAVALGPEVELLAVLDGYPGRGGTRAVRVSDAAELDEPAALRLLLESLGHDVTAAAHTPESVSELFTAHDSALGAFDAGQVRRMLDVLRRNIRLQRDFTPEVFAGTLTLLTAQGAAPDPMSWRPFVAGELRVHPTPAEHHHMLGPDALTVLAQVLGTDAVDDVPAPELSGAQAETCHVLRNDEGQYSLWPAGVAVPSGWHPVVESLPREQCLAYVDEHWTDLLPASLTEHELGVR
ncbi:amino acid adenylation domain-containing protein [Pseudonocardia spinosispora]|uniref:amino acid adenylation domain-containing protein n=1 Tax=Pseudonocardia spinosispora TaxID=103441 RepID=UPI0003F96E3D|nr:amino acid adenylation domain-containing protein [Pseudonocardia spinosispora]